MWRHALDYYGRKIGIEEAEKDKQRFFCPICASEMIPKQGPIRTHHFAHKSKESCTDSWEQIYEISEWHNEWQEKFPDENQEIVVGFGDIKHRADVLTGNTVIEFQHSHLSVSDFNKRNAFYDNLDYKVVWLFDLIDDYENNKIYKITGENGGVEYYWENTKNLFTKYDLSVGQIDLYFQINNEEKCIIKVSSLRENSNRIIVDGVYSKEEFIDMFRASGSIIPPAIRKIEIDSEYSDFCKKYSIRKLNPQQERAVQTVAGANLVLAVPGSGKTTVLITRCGYMVECKKIPAKSILAITYTKAAAEEMKKRYISIFGGKSVPEFKTINSLAYEITTKYYKIEQASEQDINRYLRKIYNEYGFDGYITESELKNAKTSIANIKNMMVCKEECEGNVIWGKPEYEVYEKYQQMLKEENKMDFDDQVVFAYDILLHKQEVLELYQSRFEYISVDEAQDTSKIQYEFIKLLASKNHNIFMVGDEDQSIYRFRAAYPKALLDFDKDYKNPYIMNMEINYRSYQEILDQSNMFIKQNANRYDKEAVAIRGRGGTVEKINVSDRESQFAAVVELGKTIKEVITAFLFRDNSCMIPVIDGFKENNIEFSLEKGKVDFFEHRPVKDVCAFLQFALNNSDEEAFKTIYSKCGFYIGKKDAYSACDQAKKYNKTIVEALVDWMHYDKRTDGDKADRFKLFIDGISKNDTADAISIIFNSGYSEYLKAQRLGNNDLAILRTIAHNHPDKKQFLEHLDELKTFISEKPKTESNIIVSTIHGSKGLEYDHVYLVDVLNGVFPHVDPTADEEEQIEQYSEECRVFYVGMTRAKNKLSVFSVDGVPSPFVELINYNSEYTIKAIDKKMNKENRFDVEGLCDKRFILPTSKTVAYCPAVDRGCSVSAEVCKQCSYNMGAETFINDAFYDSRIVCGCSYRYREILSIFDLYHDYVRIINRNDYGEIDSLEVNIEGENQKKYYGHDVFNNPGKSILSLINNSKATNMVFTNIYRGTKVKISAYRINYYRGKNYMPFISGYLHKANNVFFADERQIFYAERDEWIVEWEK